MNDVVEYVPSNVANADIKELRKKEIKRYYKEHNNLLSKMKKHNSNSLNDIMDIIIEEMAIEADNLLGNSMLFTNNGQLQDATAISVKRTEILKSLTDMFFKKFELLQRAADTDLSSPIFKLFQQLHFEKLIFTLDELELDAELKQLIVSKWGEHMNNWDKELKEKINELSS